MTTPAYPTGKPTQDDIDPARQALKDKPRNGHVFDIASILGVEGEKPVRIRRAKAMEQDTAILAAHAFVQKRADKLPNAQTDNDIIINAKHAALLATVVRRDKDNGLMPVWPTGEVLMEEVEPDTIGALIALANMVREREFAGFVPLDDETTEAIVARSVASAGQEYPEQHLAVFSHGFLARLVVNMSLMVSTLRTEIELLKMPQEETSGEG